MPSLNCTMLKNTFIDRFNNFLNCHKLRSGKQQKWPYFFLEDCSCTLNNSHFLHSPITWRLIPGGKYHCNNFRFQSWPPNESVTSAGSLHRAPKVQQPIKRMCQHYLIDSILWARCWVLCPTQPTQQWAGKCAWAWGPEQIQWPKHLCIDLAD